jgi:hypothetical protein
MFKEKLMKYSAKKNNNNNNKLRGSKLRRHRLSPYLAPVRARDEFLLAPLAARRPILLAHRGLALHFQRLLLVVRTLASRSNTKKNRNEAITIQTADTEQESNTKQTRARTKQPKNSINL